MDLSILIVNWNTRDRLAECLLSIRRTAQDIPHEVIVVDNASADSSAKMVASEFPEVLLVASKENLGFARANNVAFRKSRGRYLLLLNPDVVLLEGTVKGLVEFAEGRPDAGVVSPKLLNPDLSPQNYYGRIPTLSTVFFVYTRTGKWIDVHLFGGRIRRRDRYETYKDFDRPLALTDGGAAFCCTLIPRKVIEQIGFMDERFPVFFNDGDFACRMFEAGYKAYIVPHLAACHYGGASVKQLSFGDYTKEWVYGLRAFYRKHKGRLYSTAADLILATDLFYDLRDTCRDILSGKSGPAGISRPFRALRELLAYRPPNIPDESLATSNQEAGSSRKGIKKIRSIPGMLARKLRPKNLQ